MEQEQFRSFLADRYYRKGARCAFPNILEFQQRNERLYQMIHADMKRSCALVRFYVADQAQFPKFQILFENFFISIFAQLPQEAQQRYYQALSDVFEAVFVSFVNFQYVQKTRNFFFFDESDFKPFYGDPQQFYLGYELALNTGVAMMQQIYSHTRFENTYFEAQMRAIQAALKANDPQLGAYFSERSSQQYVMLVKLAVSSALHYCSSPSIAFPLAEFYLTGSDSALAAFGALFLSCCCRSYAPDLLDVDKRYSGRLACGAVTGFVDRQEQLFDVLTNAFSDVLARDLNVKQIKALISEAKRAAEDGVIAKALAIGGGIAVGVVSGGIALLAGFLGRGH